MYHQNFFVTEFILYIYFILNHCSFILFSEIKNILLLKNYIYSNYVQKKRFLILNYKYFFFLNDSVPFFLRFNLNDTGLILYKKFKNYFFYEIKKKLSKNAKHFKKKSANKISKLFSKNKSSVFNYILKFLVPFFIVYAKLIYQCCFNNFFMFIIVYEHFFYIKSLEINKFLHKIYSGFLIKKIFLQKIWKLDKDCIFFLYELFFYINFEKKNMKANFFIFKTRKKENCLFRNIFYIQNQLNKKNFNFFCYSGNHVSFYFKLKNNMLQVFKNGCLFVISNIFELFSLIRVLCLKTLDFLPDEMEKIFFSAYVSRTYKTTNIFYFTYFFLYLNFLIFLKLFIFKRVINKIKKIFFSFFFFLLKIKFSFIGNYLNYLKSTNRKTELIFNKVNFFPVLNLCIQDYCFFFFTFFFKKKKSFSEKIYV
ncbi:hypothetical protein CPARA_2gp277 (nucleomorph) [Cryptomonas paramecium]|uniref:Uncharacterized protein n=1 Tax=Cryptomonas paramaecium TaxID=2898 RepID=F2HHY9_9CRYP|nr:hypothetical protein CPARA_2gp277 [Cryptomonas paramecium]AEA38935.1 hypothetical protein CPARA_2gp277 [Cryptomonas paramecium]